MDTKLFVKKQSGGMFNVIDKELYPGSIFYVGSAVSGATDGAGYGQNPAVPFATLDYAIGKCTASAFDTIFLLPGHAENIASATGAVMDIAGVSVVGLGRGSLMPKLSLITAAGATLSITAANCAVRNVHIYSNFTTGVTGGITLGASANGAILDSLVFTEAANTKEFLIGIKIAANCDDLIIENCRHNGTAGGTTSSVIAAAGGTDRTIIRDNYIHVDASAAAVKLDGAASSDLQILRNYTLNLDTGAGLAIACHNSCTGVADGNMAINLKNAVTGITGTGLSYGRNYYSNALDKSCRIDPAEDA